MILTGLTRKKKPARVTKAFLQREIKHLKRRIGALNGKNQRLSDYFNDKRASWLLVWPEGVCFHTMYNVPKETMDAVYAARYLGNSIVVLPASSDGNDETTDGSLKFWAIHQPTAKEIEMRKLAL